MKINNQFDNEKGKQIENITEKNSFKEKLAWFTSKRLFIMGGVLGLVLLGVLVFLTFVYETK